MTEILNESEIEKSLTRISHEILEKNKDVAKGLSEDNIVLIGIKSRGDVIAKRIAEKIKEISGHVIPTGSLDIAFYRDDVSQKIIEPKQTNIDFDITNKKVILIDDVLYTGRSVRAALDGIIDFGRPSLIQLAVLIDRGHREFPICADYVGKNIPTSIKDKVEVRLKEVDNEDRVVLDAESLGEKIK